LNIVDITEVGQELLDVLGQYHNPPDREMLIDAALFAYLRGRFESIERQHYVYVYGSTRPRRIDFRQGGTNPIVLEFAVRPPTGGPQLYGSQNATELRKLCRVSRTQARLRALLLLDLYHTATAEDGLRDSYLSINAGRGRFERHSVRVIYVHASMTYDFSWDPYRA